MSLLESFLKYFIQPLLLAAVIAVLIRYFSRVKYERKTFRIAIDRDFYEGRHFLKNALSFFSLLQSLLCFQAFRFLKKQFLCIRLWESSRCFLVRPSI